MILLVFFLFLFHFPLSGESLNELLQEANASYQKGEKATTYEEQKEAFNNSLALYTQLEKEKIDTIPSLNQVLADNYFQLGEYPWAILYYNRALNQKPGDPLLISRLEKVQKKCGLPTSTPSKNAHQKLLSFTQNPFVLLWVTVATFFTCTCAIWFPSNGIKRSATGCLLIFFALFACFLFLYYTTPVEAILIHSSGLYRLPDTHPSQMTNIPLLAGSKVTLLQITSDGEWVKVVNSENQIGYLPTIFLRTCL